jgi:hypothetical protein
VVKCHRVDFRPRANRVIAAYKVVGGRQDPSVVLFRLQMFFQPLRAFI